MTSYIIPIIFITVILIGLITKNAPYSAFVDGAGKALNLIMSVFPYLLVVMIAVELFRESGVGGTVAEFLSPVMSLFGLPKELCELIIIRPLSGAGALAVLDNVYATYGVDSFIGNCASVIYGSSETVFYLSSVYFSKCDVKKLGPAIPIALIANFVGYTAGCAVLALFM